MGDRDNGAVPISDIRRLRYSDLRQALISSYEAKGHKSLRERSDGSDSIPGLTALDEFCGYETDTVDGELTVTDAGVPALSLTTDFARRFVEKRKKEKTGTAEHSDEFRRQRNVSGFSILGLLGLQAN
jgi:hypothetical protein